MTHLILDDCFNREPMHEHNPMYKIDFFDFQNKRFEKNGSKYICFFSTKRLFIINFRSEVTLSDSNPYPGRTVIRQIVPRPYRGLQTGTTAPESRCWWRRLPLRSPLACNQRDTESPLYFFWLTTCFRSGRQTCLYFPNGWLSIWGSISGPEMELNLGYTSLKSLYQRKMHLMWNKKMA